MDTTLNDIKAFVAEGLGNLHLPSQPAGLYEPVKYAIDGGGKRLRPLLLLAMVKATGGDYRRYINQALALEMYHNFTLLHDDVMDKASMRHGRPTVHCKWSESTAILSGDAMLSLASVMMMKDLPVDLTHKVMMVFNETALKVDEGQQLDMDFEQQEKVTLKEYEDMIMLKTGALFACACALGVLLSVDSSRQGFNALFKNAARLGYLLGVAFQLQDDYLDTYGDPGAFGKAIGGDIVNNKKTWLLINLLQSQHGKEAVMISSDISLTPADKISRITGLYDKLKLRDKLEKEIDGKLHAISGILDDIQPWFVEGGAELIKEFIAGIMHRKK